MSVLAAAQRDFLAAVVADPGPADRGIALYRRNLQGAAHKALAAAYPVVLRLVGESFFREAARGYALARPSTSGDLYAFGEHWAGFLAAYPYARGLDYLPDVARLEWAVHESHHAADGQAFDFAALGAWPAGHLGGLRLGLDPAARLVASRHPILAIWEANQGECDGVPLRDEGPDHVLVARAGYRVCPVAVPPAEWRLLDALARGETLDAACMAMGEEGAAAFGPALARHAAAGVIGAPRPARPA